MPYMTAAPTIAAAAGIIQPVGDVGVGGCANSVNCGTNGKSELSTKCLSVNEQAAKNRSKDVLAKIDRLNQRNNGFDETTRAKDNSVLGRPNRKKCLGSKLQHSTRLNSIALCTGKRPCKMQFTSKY